jgi:hypothetical protein
MKDLIQEKFGNQNESMAEMDFSEVNPCSTFVVATSAADADGLQFYFGRMDAKDSMPINVLFGRQLVVQVLLQLSSECSLKSRLLAAGILMVYVMITHHTSLSPRPSK